MQITLITTRDRGPTVRIDGEALAARDATVTRDAHDDGVIINIDAPTFRAVDAEPPVALDIAVAGVLRQYIADVAMRDTIANALIDKLNGELDLEPRIDDATFRQLEALAVDKAGDYRNRCDQAQPNQRRAAREFSLAVTHLEDAGIRFTRGLAELKNVRSDVDLEKLDALAERDRFTEVVRQATGQAPPAPGSIADQRTEPGGEAGDDTGAGGS